ncbi:MAG: ribonuclease HI [Holosporaceae bacterium]|jgi:ribonuclease HI|nr:ribonuclease HI [Holosporaceae bacterium]
MKKVTVYTDGSCSGNPGPGGWGALIIYGSIEKELCGVEPSATNNQMELTSAIKALEELKEACIVDLYSDSKYLINGMTQWMDKWIEKKWVTSEKKAVKNKELWVRLLALSRYHKISWHWVAGHSGHELNERVDRLARSICGK